MEKLRVFTAFSGYDSQCMALDRLSENHPGKFAYELIGWSEIDDTAIKAHNAVYPEAESLNYGDISKIDWDNVPDFDLFTYSFPCQDISTAGKQRGLSEDSGTRSSLLWECRKCVVAKKPKYLLMENVSQLVGKKCRPDFEKWCSELSSYGYTNYWQIMNSKDYGIPQTRKRVFMVSILGEDNWYSFPQPFALTKKLKDIVDSDDTFKKYFDNDKVIEMFKYSTEKQLLGCKICDTPIIAAQRSRDPLNPNRRGPCKEDGNIMVQTLEFGTDVSNCISTVQKDNILIEPQIIRTKRTDEEKLRRHLEGDAGAKFSGSRYFDIATDGCSNTLTSVQKDNMLAEPNDIYAVSYSRDREGTTQNKHLNSIFNTIHTRTGCGGNTDCFIGESYSIDKYLKVRYLTPRECFRLMDVDDKYIDKILSVVPKSKTFKLAGNSIVVNCLYLIFEQMFIK